MFNKNKLWLSMLLIVCMVFVSISAVSATDSTNVSNFTELNDAITAGNNATLINDINGLDEIKDGIIVNHDVTVDGNGYSIDAEFNSRIFNVINCTFTLKNITLMNGYYYGYGGAICAESSVINLEDVVFTNNIALIGGAIMANNTDIVMVNNVVFDNNSAYIGGAIAILSMNVLDTKYASFVNNRAYYAVHVFSKGDVVFHTSTNIWSEGISYYVTLDENELNRLQENSQAYEKYFNDYSVTVFDTDCLLDSFKTLNINSFDNPKDFYDVFGKYYYVSNFKELSYVLKYMANVYKYIEEDPNYSVILNNNIAKSNFLTANIILLPGDYMANERLTIGYSGKKIYDMNITIEGNGQIIDYSRLCDNYVFYIVKGNLFLNNLTITGNNKIYKYMSSIVKRDSLNSGLYISNCNFANCVIDNSLLDVGKLYIGDNVSFINNTFVWGVSSNILIMNGSNINFINNSKFLTFLEASYIFTASDNINFINNTGDVLIRSSYLFIVSNHLNYTDNNVNIGFSLSSGYINGNNLSFVNNKGTIFNKYSCDSSTYKKFNLICNSTIFYSLLNKYNIGNVTNSLIIKNNISFINNYGEKGSIFSIHGGNVYLSNVSFINNSAIEGGVIYISHSNDNIVNINADNLVFTNNSAKYGGAMYICSPIIIDSNKDKVNSFESVSTGVNTEATSLESESTGVNTEVNNTINDFMNKYKFYGVLNIVANEIIFMNNNAEYGGAIYSEYNKVNITSKNIFLRYNNAEYGGAFYLNNTIMNIVNNNTHIVGNIATIYGSAAYVFDSILILKGNCLLNNNFVFYNVTNHVMNNGNGWNVPFFINKNSFVLKNNDIITYDQFIIASSDIVEYYSNNITKPWHASNNYNTELNNIVLNQTLQQFGFNSVEELNESNCNMSLFSESYVNNFNKLFDVNNYNSYIVSQQYVLMDGSVVVYNTEFINIHNVNDFSSLTCNDIKYSYNIKLNTLFLNFDQKEYIFPKKFLKDLNDLFVETIYINGNGAKFQSETCDMSDDCQFMKIGNYNHVYISNLTFTGFNAPFINNGYLFLTNCSFNNNKVNWFVKQDYGVIINNGFLQCTNCSFVDNMAKYGSIYNAPGTHCRVVNCSFKNSASYQMNGYYDIWNYNDVPVNLTASNTNCIVFNEAGMPKWGKILLTAVVTISLAAITGLVTSALGAVGGYFMAKLAIAAGISSYFGVIAAGTVGGLVAGALVGGACGWVAGSLEAALRGGLYREQVDKIFLDYAVKGAIFGAITGAISGAIGGFKAATNVYKAFQQALQQKLVEMREAFQFEQRVANDESVLNNIRDFQDRNKFKEIYKEDYGTFYELPDDLVNKYQINWATEGQHEFTRIIDTKGYVFEVQKGGIGLVNPDDSQLIIQMAKDLRLIPDDFVPHYISAFIAVEDVNLNALVKGVKTGVCYGLYYDNQLVAEILIYGLWP